MADTKITALTAITTVDPANDVLPIVDVSDTSMAASGTTKKITTNQILGASGTATLASATITGNLTVQSNVNAPASVAFRYGPSAATWAGLRFDSTNQTFLDSDIALIFRTGGATSFTTAYTIGATGISTWSVGGSTAMTLNSTGLGVGVSPAASSKIHTFGNGNNVYAVFQNGDTLATNKTSQLWLSNGPTFLGANNREYRIVNLGTSATASDLVFDYWTGSAIAERLRIDSSGNVGIGVAPSATFASNRRALQIGGLASGAVALNGTSGSGEIFFNSFFNTSSQNICVVTGGTGKYDFNVSTVGAHSWSVGTGTAGNAFTFTQAMTLDGNGNLILQSSATPATLTTNGQLTVNATSNTNLRFSYRGSDGITRVANITLA